MTHPWTVAQPRALLAADRRTRSPACPLRRRCDPGGGREPRMQRDQRADAYLASDAIDALEAGRDPFPDEVAEAWIIDDVDEDRRTQLEVLLRATGWELPVSLHAAGDRLYARRRA